MTRRGVWAAAAVFGTGLAAGAVISQTGFATAASTTPPNPPAYGSVHDGHRMGPGMPPGLRALGGPVGRPLHGEVFTQKPGSTTTNDVVFWVGKATVDTTAKTITVTSSDGKAGTFATDSTTKVRKDGKAATLSDVKDGDTVRVVGLKDGSTVTAKLVQDGKPPARPGMGRHHWPDNDGDTGGNTSGSTNGGSGNTSA